MDHVTVEKRLLAELELLRPQYEEDLSKLIELTDYKIALKVLIGMEGGPLPKRPDLFPTTSYDSGLA